MLKNDYIRQFYLILTQTNYAENFQKSCEQEDCELQKTQAQLDEEAAQAAQAERDAKCKLSVLSATDNIKVCDNYYVMIIYSNLGNVFLPSNMPKIWKLRASITSLFELMKTLCKGWLK